MPLRHRSDFKQALSTLERLHQKSRRRTTRAYLLLQAQTMAVGTEFIFYMVELARLLVVFLQIQKVEEGGEPSLEWTERPVTCSILAKTSEDGFQEFNLFSYSWIVYSGRRSTVTDGGV